jgi:hypothetical protein
MQKLAEGKPDLLTLAQWLDLKPGVERAVAREYYDKGSIDAGRIAGRIKQSGAITSELEVQLILNRFMRN